MHFMPTYLKNKSSFPFKVDPDFFPRLNRIRGKKCRILIPGKNRVSALGTSRAKLGRRHRHLHAVRYNLILSSLCRKVMRYSLWVWIWWQISWIRIRIKITKSQGWGSGIFLSWAGSDSGSDLKSKWRKNIFIF